MNTKYPEFLYHYTSINTLALILNTKKLRFNRLDKVDDTTEANSMDLGNLGRFFFVSCWTDSPEENIPLWAMYTPNMSGVRIKLPVKMFKTYKIESNPDLNLTVTGLEESILPYERLHTDQYIALPVFNTFDNFLCKIEYLASDNTLNHRNLTTSNGIHTFNFDNFGRYKQQVWQFQSEWRFILTILPAPGPQGIKTTPDYAQVFAQFILGSIFRGNLPFNEFLLDLKEEVIDQIEVMLGPKCNHSDKVLVESLLARFCKNAILISSQLSGKIR